MAEELSMRDGWFNLILLLCQRSGIRHAEHKSLLNWSDDRSPLSVDNRRESNSRILASPERVCVLLCGKVDYI